MNVLNRRGPIVVAAFAVECDRGQHAVEVITDGTRIVSASGDRYGTRNTAGVTRTGSRFTVPCPAWVGHDQCDGIVTVDTAGPASWRAATPGDASWLDTDAQEVDHA